MKEHYWISTAGMLVLALGAALAQDTGAAPATPDDGQQPAPPVPAYGPDNSVAPITENPPLSGLDEPGLEPHAAPLSYLQPGALVSESADSNVTDTLGGSSTRSISRGLASVTLQRLWSNYALAVDYLGGVAYYNTHGLGWKLVQQMDLDQKITWKRGQLSIRDSFSYLPEGNFGTAYGTLGSHGITSMGSSFGMFGGVFGGSVFGGLGEAPRIMNVTVVDISQNLTPKSAITAAGGYAFTHFTGRPDPVTAALVGNSFLGSSQISAQAGYNRVLTRHDQIALVYAYQGFDFSAVGTAFHSHIIQGMYGHRISGRMDFLIGAGPQITKIDNTTEQCSVPFVPLAQCTIFGGTLSTATLKTTRLGFAGRGQLRYKFPKTMLELSYDRYETSGSGFFAGAQSDIAHLKAVRPITRVWSGFADLGFARNSRLQPSTVGVNANTYTYGFAGAGMRRMFGHTLNLFASYQFNELSFDRSLCGGSGACSRTSQRHVGTIGLEWTPRPIRID